LRPRLRGSNRSLQMLYLRVLRRADGLECARCAPIARVRSDRGSRMGLHWAVASVGYEDSRS
jgi:hypothetical protein